jgi:hypothetical protein
MKIFLTHILKYLFKGKNRNLVDRKETWGVGRENFGWLKSSN